MRSLSSKGLARNGTLFCSRKLRTSGSARLENVNRRCPDSEGQVSRIQRYVSCAVVVPGIFPLRMHASNDSSVIKALMFSMLVAVVTSAPAPAKTSRSNSRTLSSSSTRRIFPLSTTSCFTGAVASGSATAARPACGSFISIIAPPDSALRAEISPPCSLMMP